LKPVLVLCLGNEVLCDDSLGPKVAGELSQYPLHQSAEVLFAPVAGFALLDLLNDRQKVLIVDSIKTGKNPPGSLTFFKNDNLVPSNGLINSHQINLPTALELGRQLGYNIPASIDILAVEVTDIETITEDMTPPVENAKPKVIACILDWLEQNTKGELI